MAKTESGSRDPIPRGIEVLVKKAAVDADFKQILIERRARAADEIDLRLEPSEIAMLNAVPEAQLEAIIDRTTVHPKLRPAFLGRVAAVMIVALGASSISSGCGGGVVQGERSDRPERPGEVEPTKGTAPDRPEQTEQDAEARRETGRQDKDMWGVFPAGQEASVPGPELPDGGE